MNATEETAGRLAECMETLTTSLMELTAVFRVKRKVLAGGDMDALWDLLDREEKVVEALFAAESTREILAEELAAVTGVESRRLCDMAESLPGGPREVLLECGGRLKTTVDVLIREARVVAVICQAAVEHYEKLIRIITGAELAGATYDAGGRTTAGPGGRSIIDQAV